MLIGVVIIFREKVKKYIGSQLLFVAFLSINQCFLCSEKYAVVTAPVLDAIIKPKSEQILDSSFYKQLSCAVEKGSLSPFRVHQLIYNEVVKVKEDREHELLVELLNVIYVDKQNNNSACAFWCLKEQVVILDESQYEKFKPYLPEPFEVQSVFEMQNTQITLKEPWYSSMKGVIYSAGTSFRRNSSYDTNDEYGVYLFNAKPLTIEIMLIPKSKVYAPSGNLLQDRLKDFVNLLKSWCQYTENEIAYIWGGCSFTEKYLPKFQLVKINNELLWDRTKTACCHSGFDCSGLVLRAAQIVRLPYWFKNTTTIKKNLASRKATELLAEGDLIWFPGHVMVIADIKNNLVIESRGYAAGYGKVHMTSLKTLFKGISTFDELRRVQYDKGPLMLLNSKGEDLKEITEFDILKIE